MSPTRPTMVRWTPRLTNAEPPAPSTRVTTASTSSGDASGRITTTMVGAPHAVLFTKKSPGAGAPGLVVSGASAGTRPGVPAGKDIPVAAHAPSVSGGGSGR